MPKKEKKRVLLIHRFFYPDSPPYAIILENMRKELGLQGYHIDVLSSKPSYKSVDKTNKKVFKENYNGSTVYRIPVVKLQNSKIEKILNFFWFPLAVFFFMIFQKKYDVVTVSTAPQVFLGYFVALATKIKSSKLIYHCMDIHPEIGRLSGEFKNKYIFKLLTVLDNVTCNTAKSIIVLSSDMRTSLAERIPRVLHKIEIINNYDLATDDKLQDNFFPKNSLNVKRVVFAGNIGRYQNLESFVLALKDQPVIENFELIFVGEGKVLNELKLLAQGIETTIRFIPHQPIAIARKIISEADMAIVSLQRDVIKYAYPSKTMTYLAEGTAIILNVGDKYEISNFIEKNNLGVSVDAEDLNSIYELFQEISSNKISYERENIKKVFYRNFSKEQFHKKINDLFKKTMEEI